MITLAPWGGLCNRMRATASALVLAREADVPLKLLWYRTRDFNCSFGRIFDIAHMPCVVQDRDAKFSANRLAIRSREQWLRFRGARVYTPEETTASRFNSAEFIAEARTREVSVRTFSALAGERGMYDCFRPTAFPADRLADLLGRTANAVGVHIRRTDNAKAIAASPLSSFIKLMECEIDSDGSTRFFLATDSDRDIGALRDRFGERILTYPKRAYRRDDPAAIEDAVVDLYGLAHCRKLIGSYWSSFSDTAHEMRQIERVVAGKPL